MWDAAAGGAVGVAAGAQAVTTAANMTTTISMHNLDIPLPPALGELRVLCKDAARDCHGQARGRPTGIEGKMRDELD